MTPDQIDAIKTCNDPNSCDRSDDESTYTITEWDRTELVHQTKGEVIDYTVKELTTFLFRINTAYSEEGEEAAFVVAKEYLDHFSALQEEE